MRKISVHTIASLLALTGAAGCSTGGSHDDGAAQGKVSVALTVPADAKHDVASAHFVVVPQGGSCTDVPIAETTADIEDEGLIDSLDPAGGGLRAFVDGLMSVPEGTYHVCVTLLQESGQPSAECARVEDDVMVVAGQTTEIALFSECSGEGTGLVDVAVGLNDEPVIDKLTIGPSKFITTCETATINVTAHDPNGDDLTYFWDLTGGPAGGTLVGNGATATFSTSVAGSYQARVTVYDSLGASSSLSFPIHVTASDVECASACPAGTVEAAGACWIVANTFEVGTDSCGRAGLVGAELETGVPWTAALMAEVTTALGCANLGLVTTPGSFEEPSLFIDTATRQCFTPAFSEPGSNSYVNAPFNHGFPNAGPAAVHMCQRPVAPVAAP